MAHAISVLWAVLVPCAVVPALGAGSDVEFITEELPWAVVGRDYSPAPFEVRVTGRCPAGGVGFSVASGALPPGLKLSRLGYFSGTPKQTGQFEFNVRAVNGCSSISRHFALLVTDPPTLAVTPAKVSVTCPAGGDPQLVAICPAAVHPLVIHVVGNWPDLAYQVSVSGGDWLTATPERGRTSSEAVPRRLKDVHSDDIALRLNTAGLKPGQYAARVVVSAWQAEQAVIAVELTILNSP